MGLPYMQILLQINLTVYVSDWFGGKSWVAFWWVKEPPTADDHHHQHYYSPITLSTMFWPYLQTHSKSISIRAKNMDFLIKMRRLCRLVNRSTLYKFVINKTKQLVFSIQQFYTFSNYNFIFSSHCYTSFSFLYQLRQLSTEQGKI